MPNGKIENIVEAYRVASTVVSAHAHQQVDAYERVIDFCEHDQKCALENSLKRNTLLFWSYLRLMRVAFAKAQYDKVLTLGSKAQSLPRSPYARIEVGNLMLDAVDKSGLSLPAKAGKIIGITRCLAAAYRLCADDENAARMVRLQQVAETFLQPRKFSS
jgi:hypothetical protein